MKHVLFSLLSLLLILAVPACDESDDGGSSAGEGDNGTDDADAQADLPTLDMGVGDAPTNEDQSGGTAPVLGFSCPDGQSVAQDLNTGWSAGGEVRQFFADLPSADDNVPVGVIFVWHGLGDSIDNFRRFVAPDPDGWSFPFIVITPQALDLTPISNPPGVPWTVLTSEPGDGNIDVALFSSILGCLEEQRAINTSRIYSLGFSGGAIMTDLLHARFPDIIHTGVAMSGAYFNNPDTVAGVNTMGVATVEWADFPESSTGTILMTHGGANDTFGMATIEVINFENAAQSDMPFLTNASRTVIDCPHTSGHSNHPGINPSTFIDFFEAHPAGATSPYWVDGLPSALSSICELR